MTASYFENMPLLMPGSTTYQPGVSQMRMAPFVLSDGISFGAVRFPLHITYSSTTQTGTSNNTTVSCARMITFAAVIFSQGTGVSSNSLLSVTSGNGLFDARTFYVGGTAGSEYTVSFNITFPKADFGGSTFSTSHAVTSTRINVSSESITNFPGSRFIDVPISTSLPAGNYWMGIGLSTSSSTNGGLADFCTNAIFRLTNIGASQSNLSFGHLAAATNATIGLQPGAGAFSTNSALFSTSAMDISQIILVASNPMLYFQLINRA